MIFPTSGARLFIGASHSDWRPGIVTAEHFDEGAWVEIGGLTSLGRLGGQWEPVQMPVPNVAAASAAIETVVRKGARTPKTMEIMVSLALADPGLLRLLEAEESTDAFDFCIKLRAGIERRFVGLVMGVDDEMGEADSELTMVASVVLQSTILRS